MIETHRFIRITWVDRVAVSAAFGLPIIISLAIHFWAAS